jgi:hypothetical protein
MVNTPWISYPTKVVAKLALKRARIHQPLGPEDFSIQLFNASNQGANLIEIRLQGHGGAGCCRMGPGGTCSRAVQRPVHGQGESAVLGDMGGGWLRDRPPSALRLAGGVPAGIAPQT